MEKPKHRFGELIDYPLLLRRAGAVVTVLGASLFVGSAVSEPVRRLFSGDIAMTEAVGVVSIISGLLLIGGGYVSDYGRHGFLTEEPIGDIVSEKVFKLRQRRSRGRTRS